MLNIDRIALALSDPIRLRILDLLVTGRDAECCSPDNPELPQALCSCDLRPNLDNIAPSKLSYHMKELRESGLISEQKRGRWIYYSLNQDVLAGYLKAVEARYLKPGRTLARTGLVPVTFDM